MTVKRQPLDFGTHFDVTKHIRLVRPFQEKEVDKYFLHFEKVAENLKWPKEHWTLLLQSVIIGKAREIYTQLTVEQSSSYDTVKELILKAYELVPEAYRQKFRNCKKENEQTHVEFARTKEQLFDRWCSSKKIGSDHEKLRQLMLVEEFKRCINSDIKFFLDEKQVETLEAAAPLADDYALIIYVYVSQLIRYARTCSNYQDFMERGKVLTQKLLSQGYQKTKLVATLKKFYGRHHDLVNPYNVAVSRIVSDVFASDAP